MVLSFEEMLEEEFQHEGLQYKAGKCLTREQLIKELAKLRFMIERRDAKIGRLVKEVERHEIVVEDNKTPSDSLFKSKITCSQFDFDGKQSLAILKLMRYAFNLGVSKGADNQKRIDSITL